MTTESRRMSLEEFAANAADIVRDVLRGRTSVVIEDERGGQVLMAPVGVRVMTDPELIKRPPTPEEVQRTLDGINRAAGAWKGLVDAEEFKAYIRERRRTKNRPSVRF